MNTDRSKRLLEGRRSARRKPTRGLRRWRFFVPLAALAFGTLPHVAGADPPLSADEVRDRRLVQEERPLWREALAFPDDVLLLLSWPVEQFLCWAERVRLGTRVQDVVLAPIRSEERQER
jgi:hypothetical protein